MQNQTPSHALATHTQTRTPDTAKGALANPGANVRDLGGVRGLPLGPKSLSQRALPWERHVPSDVWSLSSLLIVPAATVLVQATALSPLAAAAAASLRPCPAVCPVPSPTLGCRDKVNLAKNFF